MTDPADPRPPGKGGAEDSRAEQVLSQALRVMAGGGKSPTAETDGMRSTRRFNTSQLSLRAENAGLLIGNGAGFFSLML